MNKDVLEFMSNNEDEINRLLIEITKTRKELRRKLEDLSKLIDLKKLNNVKQSYYREPSGHLFDTLVHDINVNNELTIAIDTILTPGGWYFDVFPRPKSSGNFEDLIKSKKITLVSSYDYGRSRLSKEFDYDESLEEIAKTLQSLIDNISVIL